MVAGFFGNEMRRGTKIIWACCGLLVAFLLLMKLVGFPAEADQQASPLHENPSRYLKREPYMESKEEMKGHRSAEHGQDVQTVDTTESPQLTDPSRDLVDPSRHRNPIVLKERIVHLDLKGAPPRVSYLQQLFPLMRKAGATGLLIEWEDMLPYEGPLRMVRSGYAYSKEDVAAILQAAEKNELKVIPLLQTFGHMEWVLKHKEFADVREISRYPQVLCPSNPKSLELVKLLVDQVMAMHPSIDTFHIGSDETYYLGDECKVCQEAVKQEGKHRLMLKHVSSVAKYLRSKYGVKRVLMWHDMFIKAESSLLADMKTLIEPVIWDYSPDVSKRSPPDLFKRFGEGFDGIWIASAFKGANGSSQSFVDTDRYLQNHVSWLDMIGANHIDVSKWQGIILTGWQRFDHFAGLCEIFPVAMPSLITALLFLQDGRMEPGLMERVTQVLVCDKQGDCGFPGAPVLKLVEELKLYRQTYDKIESSHQVKGWLSPYSLKNQYSSVFIAEQVYNKSEALIKNMTDVGQQLRQGLEPLFFDDTVNEWLFENIQTFINSMKDRNKLLGGIIQTVSFRNRPLNRDHMDF